MVANSLRYWATEMRVDGFRFDLATILAREPYGFDEGGGFLDACRQDPVLSSVKLIAEPWDIGPGGYQVGRFPPGWAEWNDKFRDNWRLLHFPVLSAPEDPVPLRGAYHAPRNGLDRRRTSDAPGTKVPAVCGCGSLPLRTSCKLFLSFAATSP